MSIRLLLLYVDCPIPLEIILIDCKCERNKTVKRDRWDIILRYWWRKTVCKRTELNDTRRVWSSQWEASHQAINNERGKRVRVSTIPFFVTMVRPLEFECVWFIGEHCLTETILVKKCSYHVL
jgi:hypothetical protein